MTPLPVELVIPPPPLGGVFVQVCTRKVISRWLLPMNVSLRYSLILYTTSERCVTLGLKFISPVAGLNEKLPAVTVSGAVAEAVPR